MLTGNKLFYSISILFIPAFSDEVAGLSTWWVDSDHGYIFLSPSRVGSSTVSFVRSCPASLSSIFPIFCPTSSITLSIQLKDETASWKRVPQKAVSTHTPHPPYLKIMANPKKIVTTSLSPPHTINRSDTKNRKGLLTEYKGM
jgi:hypothetical protein